MKKIKEFEEVIKLQKMMSRMENNSKEQINMETVIDGIMSSWKDENYLFGEYERTSRAWKNPETIAIEYLPWGKNAKQDTKHILKVLKKFGYDEFIITSESTALMEQLCILMNLGCKIEVAKLTDSGYYGHLNDIKEYVKVIIG